MTTVFWTEHDLEVLRWIIQRLYDGGSWRVMEQQRPEINEVCERLGIWEREETDG